MSPRKVKLARGRKQATSQRGRYSVCKICGLLCMILVFATTVRAGAGQIGGNKGWSGEVGGIRSPTQEPHDRENNLQGSQLNRVAIIGGGIGGISIAHSLLNDANQLHPPQVTLFEKEPQFGGRIHFTRLYGHGTTVNTAGFTFDADDMLIEEIANLTSISLRDWWHNGWNTESRSLLYWMSRIYQEKTTACPAEESIDMTWMELAGLLRQHVAYPSFWIKYLGYIRQAFSQGGEHRDLLNVWERRIHTCNRRANALLWAGYRAKAGQSLELRSRITGSDGTSAKPQKELRWNQHDRMFTGLLGDLYDHEGFTAHRSSAVTKVTRFGNGTFGVHWTRDIQDGSQERHMDLFDNLIIATPFHQAALEFEPPLPAEPEEITYTPIHSTSIISERLPESLLLQPHGAQWRTSAALLWPKYLRHQVKGLNATGLPVISIAREEAVWDDCELPRYDLTRMISGELFSDEDIAALFHGKDERVTFPNQSCFIPQHAEPDMVRPRYHNVREEFALAAGAVNRSSGCVTRPTISWVHRDYWPNGLPVINRDGKRGKDAEWSELVPGMFYVNGFERREGASVSKSIENGRKVKDALVVRYVAAQL